MAINLNLINSKSITPTIVANYPSPLFIFDTILTGERTSRFSEYVSNWDFLRTLLFISFLWIVTMDKFKSGRVPPVVDYVLATLSTVSDKFSFFSSGKTAKLEEAFNSLLNTINENKLKKAKSLISNILKYGAYFYLGTGVKSYNIQMIQISNIVNLGANRAERFGWGTERITIALDGVYTLKPFRIWDNTLNNNQDITGTPGIPYVSYVTYIQSLYYHIVRLLNSTTSINPGQGYPTWPSLGEILSYFLETFFREFGHQTFFLVFLNRIYYGWVTSLTLSRSAESPMVLTYRLNFEAHPASGWLITDTYAISKGIETIMSTKPEKVEAKAYLSSESKTVPTGALVFGSGYDISH
jgi:hypothetical protein